MRIYRVVLFAAVSGMLLGFILLSANTAEDLFDIINKLGFSEFGIPLSYSNVILWYAPYILFEAVWGTWIYGRFCTASVYYFSRQKARGRWFWQEALKLFFQVFCFLAVLAVCTALPEMCLRKIGITIEAAVLFGYYLAIHTLWLYGVTLLINILSIRWGSNAGFLFAAGIQTLCISLFSVLERFMPVDEETGLMQNAEVLKLNPISHLVLKWHSSEMENIERRLDWFGISFGLNESAAWFLLFAVCVSAAGFFIIKHQEFIVNNRETGG